MTDTEKLAAAADALESRQRQIADLKQRVRDLEQSNAALREERCRLSDRLSRRERIAKLSEEMAEWRANHERL